MSEIRTKTGRSTINFHNCDNIEFMKNIPDNFYDLAIVDPEFGIGIAKSPRLVTDKGLKAKNWDDKPINKNYFIELFRISKTQIIWGANYYKMPPTKHCIIWDKIQPEKLSFGMFDFVWTSFSCANKIFRYSVQLEKNKIHPTQKPVALYKWLLTNYAKQGDKILDTHGGSASIALACWDLKFNLDLCELDEDYFNDSWKRFENHTNQQQLF